MRGSMGGITVFLLLTLMLHEGAQLQNKGGKGKITDTFMYNIIIAIVNHT